MKLSSLFEAPYSQNMNWLRGRRQQQAHHKFKRAQRAQGQAQLKAPQTRAKFKVGDMARLAPHTVQQIARNQVQIGQVGPSRSNPGTWTYWITIPVQETGLTK